jgi:hypothetical protein
MPTSWGSVVFKTRMPTSWRVYKNLLVGDWPILCGREQALQGPPRTSQHITACQSSTAKIFFEDPEVLLAAELGPWPWWLQEQSHGASARAPSRQGAQSGCQQRPRQLVNIGLDSSNKAEAAHLVKGISKPTSLAFLVGTAVPPRCSQTFGGNEWEMEPQETTCKNKILLYWRQRTSSETFPQWTWATSLKGWYRRSREMRLGKKS